MNQRINLYRKPEAPAAKRVFLSWSQLLLSNVFFFLFLILIYLYHLFSLHQLEAQKVLATKQEAQAAQEYATRKALLPPEFSSQDVASALLSLKKTLDAERRIIESIRNPHPFSQDLIALSQVVVPNLWLTSILIEEGGLDATLKGMSIGMEPLRTFIHNVSQDKQFDRQTVEIKNISTVNKTEVPVKLTFEIKFSQKKMT